MNRYPVAFPNNTDSATNFAAWLVLEICIAGNAATFAIANTYPITDTSNAAMEQQMQNATLEAFPGSATGWWAAGETPELRHFWFRSPLLLNRFRIHNYGYLVVD